MLSIIFEIRSDGPGKCAGVPIFCCTKSFFIPCSQPTRPVASMHWVAAEKLEIRYCEAPGQCLREFS